MVPEDSSIQTLQDLGGKEVAFVSPDAFAGYWLPMDALLKSKVRINVVFTGNQEASSAQLTRQQGCRGRREQLGPRALCAS